MYGTLLDSRWKTHKPWKAQLQLLAGLFLIFFFWEYSGILFGGEGCRFAVYLAERDAYWRVRFTVLGSEICKVFSDFGDGVITEKLFFFFLFLISIFWSLCWWYSWVVWKNACASCRYSTKIYWHCLLLCIIPSYWRSKEIWCTLYCTSSCCSNLRLYRSCMA